MNVVAKMRALRARLTKGGNDVSTPTEPTTEPDTGTDDTGDGDEGDGTETETETETSAE